MQRLWRKHQHNIYREPKHLSLRRGVLLIGALLLVATPVINVITPDTVNAKNNNQMSPEEQALSYAYYWALVGSAQNTDANSCIKDNIDRNKIEVSVGDSDKNIPRY